MKVIKDSTTPKPYIHSTLHNLYLKVIKDSTTPKQGLKAKCYIRGLKVIKDSTTPKPQNMRPNSAIFNIIII